VPDDLLRDALDDVVVLVQQVVAAHAGLAREPRRDDHDVRVRRIGVVIGAEHPRLRPFDRARLEDVESLALGDALENVEQHDVGELLVREAARRRGADVPRADDADFAVHGA